MILHISNLIQARSINNTNKVKVEDIVRILTDSVNPKDYIKQLRKRDGEHLEGWGQFVPTLLNADCKRTHEMISCNTWFDYFLFLSIFKNIPY